MLVQKEILWSWMKNMQFWFLFQVWIYIGFKEEYNWLITFIIYYKKSNEMQELYLNPSVYILILMIVFHCYVISTLWYLLSPRNALRSGYSNAAVVPCVRACMCASVRASVRGPCEHNRDYTVSCFFVKLGRHVNHEGMNPIDFGGQRSKVKVTMDIYGNKLVNTIETKPLCISLSNLADMLAMVRGWTLLILGSEVRGQGHNGHIWN